MKKIAVIICITLAGIFPAKQSFGQADEIAQLALNIGKLSQLKSILKNLEKGYEILNGGYNVIINITKGNYNLHKGYLDGLLNVSPTVRNYHRVAEIIRFQLLLVRNYEQAFARFHASGNFHPNELAYMGRVYDNLLEASLRNLEELTNILLVGKTRMSDDERLQEIDKIYTEMEKKILFLKHFNNQNAVLERQRAKEKRDIRVMEDIHGIND